MKPALTIDYELEIAAPPETVWAVIMDFSRYAEWNPFVVGCRSSLKVGEPIHMKVRLLAFAQPQTETILDHVPGQRLCYGLHDAWPHALSSRRCHEVLPSGNGGTRYRSTFRLSGWLAGFVRLLLGGRLRAGFAGMSNGIRQRAEQLAGAK